MPRYQPDALVTPANAVTLLRFALTPVMLGFIADRRLDWPTFGMWFVLCASDGIDGWLARWLGTTTSGAFLDPLADKVLVIGALITLVTQDVFWWVWVALIAFREVGMSVYRSVVARRGISIPARRSAKWKTVVQQFAVAFALLPWVASEWPEVAEATLLVAVALTVVSGLQYAWDGRRRVRAGVAT